MTQKEVFVNWMTEEDHAEALVIDKHFDGPEFANLDYEQRLDIATAAAHEELLSSHKPLHQAERVGHQVMRDSARWLLYRGAHIFDEFPALSENEQKFTQATQQAQKDHEMIKFDVPVTIYATLEALRRHRERNGQAAYNPVEVERDLSIIALINSIDTAIEGSDALTIESDPTTSETIFNTSLFMGTEIYRGSFRRKITPDSKEYDITIHEKLSEDEQKFADKARLALLGTMIAPPFLRRYKITLNSDNTLDAVKQYPRKGQLHELPMESFYDAMYLADGIIFSGIKKDRLIEQEINAQPHEAQLNGTGNVAPICTHPWSPIPELRPTAQ